MYKTPKTSQTAREAGSWYAGFGGADRGGGGQSQLWWRLGCEGFSGFLPLFEGQKEQSVLLCSI